MQMTKPTVGLSVWYRHAPDREISPLVIHDGEQPFAAIIAHVNSDDNVNLAVFGQDGGVTPRANVPLGSDELPETTAYWEYQQSQPVKKKKEEPETDTKSAKTKE
jgi:hypothetical protein